MGVGQGSGMARILRDRYRGAGRHDVVDLRLRRDRHASASSMSASISRQSVALVASI